MGDLGSEFEVIECIDKKWFVEKKYIQIDKVYSWGRFLVLPYPTLG